MTIKEILAGESKNTEFKVSRPDKSIKYMKSVVAFANGKGGRIVFGIDDTRTVVGIPNEDVFSEMDAIANAVSDSCEPLIVPDIYPQTIDGKTIIIAEIRGGDQKPYYIKSDGIANGVYIRVSGTSRKADRALTQEMYYESGGRSYDSVICRDFKISDDDIQRLCAEMKQIALKNCKNDYQRQSVKDVTKNVLLSWGILAEDNDGAVYPTNAYVFLTGQDLFLSKIQCGMFKGETRAVFVDKREYTGPLWNQIEEAFNFVLRNIRLGAKIEGIYRKDIYELPPDSIRELIINSVMNCSFLQASHIQVAVYDNRLEITSPGGLMPGVTIERMSEGYSQIRNRVLANAFSYMNLIEGWGTGIPRLMREMKEYGLKEPEFIDMDTALRINLYRAEAAENPDAVPDTSDKLPDSRDKLSDSQKKVPDSRDKLPDTLKKVPDTPEKVPDTSGKVLDTPKKVLDTIDNMPENQAEICREILKEGSITSKRAAEILGIKKRRATDILKNMAAAGIIKKDGAARATKYVMLQNIE